MLIWDAGCKILGVLGELVVARLSAMIGHVLRATSTVQRGKTQTTGQWFAWCVFAVDNIV